MSLDLPIRPRRNRKSPVVRDFARETFVGPEHFALPLVQRAFVALRESEA